MNLSELSHLLDKMPLPACLAHADSGVISHSNPSFADWFGDQNNEPWEQVFRPLRVQGKQTIGRFRHLSVQIEKAETNNMLIIYCRPFSDLPENVLETAERAASVLVHRLRSPITGLQGFLSMSADDDNAPFIQKGFKEITGILNQIETLTHTQKPQMKEISVGSLLRSVVSTHFRTQQQKIEIKTSPEPFVVLSDHDFLTFILIELLTNALDQIDPALGSVTIQPDSEKQILRIRHDGDALSEEVARNLFYPFYTTKARGLGLGLPLSIQKARACRHEIALTKNSRVDGVELSLFL